jgi:hypothetical protein
MNLQPTTYNLQPNKGAILIVTILVLVILLFVVIYFLDLVTTGSRVSRSYSLASQTYYLAEAGMNEAIWKLKNDWEDEFKTNPDWSIDYTRSPALYPNGSYTIHVQNSEKADGKISVVGQLDIGGGRQAQRIVKIEAFKALNPGPIKDAAFYGNGEVFSTGSNIKISGDKASFFTNRDILILLGSDFEVSGDGCNEVLSTRNITVDGGSSLTADQICSKNKCISGGEDCPGGCVKCPPDELAMPGVDFHEHEVNSYLAQAQQQEDETGIQHVFTAGEIADLLWDNENLTLPESGVGIIYIDGDINLKGGRNLTVNGVLVVENSVSMVSPGQTVNIKDGGLISKTSFFISLLLDQNLNITYDKETVNGTLQQPKFAPVITIDHWEEKY